MKTLPFKKTTHMFVNVAGVLLLSHVKTSPGTYIMSFHAGEWLPYVHDYESLYNYFAFSVKHLVGNGPYLYLSGEEMREFFDEKDIFLFLMFYGKAL